jgi:hypothetical protein
MPNLSWETANRYFEEHILPRRVRDDVAEQKYHEKYDKHKIIYRKVLPGEKNRGELYPVCTAGLATFAQFGIGIGLYFFQLLMLAALCLVCVVILSPMIHAYQSSAYGLSPSTATQKGDSILSTTAACESVNITATINCPNNANSCIIRYTPHCAIPTIAIYTDLIMCLVACSMLVASRYLVENPLIEELDEAVQTTSDYAVAVLDPPSDADFPGEWFQFFSRFGQVRSISIVRKNRELVVELLRLQHVTELITSYQQLHTDKFTDRYQQLWKIQQSLQSRVLELCRGEYPVARVYAIFELEEEQRLCLQALEVPDIVAIFDLHSSTYTSQARKLFRKHDVLNVQEPVEPDDVLYFNLGLSRGTRLTNQVLSISGTIGVYIAVWYFVAIVKQTISPYLGLVISLVDAMLPRIFEYLTNLSHPHDESRRLSLLQLRLFAARLLLSTLLPYFQTSWTETLTTSNIQQILSVQYFACFFNPFLTFLDLSQTMKRYLFAYWFPETQSDLDSRYFCGTTWSLAEKYTILAKILAVTLCPALLSPISLLFTTVAFLLLFNIERWLLLRRYAPQSLLNETIALLLRQEVLLIICIHMIMSTQYIYAWPMDQAYVHYLGSDTPLTDYTSSDYSSDSASEVSRSILASINSNSYNNNNQTIVVEYVNKQPSLALWKLTRQPWQTPGQQRGLIIYEIGCLIMIIITLIIWIIVPLFSSIRSLFCSVNRVIGQSQNIPFSSLLLSQSSRPNITTGHNNNNNNHRTIDEEDDDEGGGSSGGVFYEPYVHDPASHGTRSYRCVDAVNVPEKFRAFIGSRLDSQQYYTQLDQQQQLHSNNNHNHDHIEVELAENTFDHHPYDLARFVPELYRNKVLSIVTYYPLHTTMTTMMNDGSILPTTNNNTMGEEVGGPTYSNNNNNNQQTQQHVNRLLKRLQVKEVELVDDNNHNNNNSNHHNNNNNKNQRDVTPSRNSSGYSRLSYLKFNQNNLVSPGPIPDSAPLIVPNRSDSPPKENFLRR